TARTSRAPALARRQSQRRSPGCRIAHRKRTWASSASVERQADADSRLSVVEAAFRAHRLGDPRSSAPLSEGERDVLRALPEWWSTAAAERAAAQSFEPARALAIAPSPLARQSLDEARAHGDLVSEENSNHLLADCALLAMIARRPPGFTAAAAGSPGSVATWHRRCTAS